MGFRGKILNKNFQNESSVILSSFTRAINFIKLYIFNNNCKPVMHVAVLVNLIVVSKLSESNQLHFMSATSAEFEIR